MVSIDPCNPDLPKSHPELFHYTTFDGLRGILEARALWATHYSHLNDSTEINFVQTAVTSLVAERLLPVIKRAQRNKLTIRRNVQKLGGLQSAARILAKEVLSVIHRAVFTQVARPIIADPYISSFCSHSNDESYERSQGLLSQWRGYGGAGGYCIVFDTSRLIDLLSTESESHFWSYMNLDAVVYSNDVKKLEMYTDQIATGCEDCADTILNGGSPKNFDDLLLPYLQAATHIKHRGFIEEREVRIVVAPIIPEQIAAFVESIRLSFEITKAERPNASFKEIHSTSTTMNRRYVALFEGLGKDLPIKRIIVGPSLKQRENHLRAARLVKDRIELSCSETPFIGQGLGSR